MFDKIGEILRGGKPKTPEPDPVTQKLAEADTLKRNIAATSAYRQVDTRTRGADQQRIDDDEAKLRQVEQELEDMGHMKLPSVEGAAVIPSAKKPFPEERPQEIPQAVPPTAPETEKVA